METVKEIIKEMCMENIPLFNCIDKTLKESLEIKSIKQMQDELVDDINKNRGNYSGKFVPALVFGKKGEAIIRKTLENKGYVFMSECSDITSDHTYLRDGRFWVFEIKTDSRHKFIGDDGTLADTGNIFFEYSCRGKDSGRKATKAEFFITYFPQLNELWLIKTKKINKLIDEESKYEFIEKKDVGDPGSQTHGHVTKRKKIMSEFSVVNVSE
jgi:hypothetical protein